MKTHPAGSPETSIDTSLRSYYAVRAPEYDRIYLKPERQSDLRSLQHWLPPLFNGCRLLEVACGTGYWTQFLAPAVSELVAVDAAPETLKIAAGRITSRNVRFVVGDAYYLPDCLGQFDAAFLGFWFSHLPMRRRRTFLQNLANRLHDGARVLILDNLFVEGSNRPITEKDEDGNTYQSRRLDDDSTHRVLKNFPTESELVTLCAGLGKSMVYTAFEYYWAFQYEAVK